MTSSGSSSACISCGAGNYSVSGSAYCSVCPIGTYAESSIGATACISCPPNTFNSYPGGSSIVACQSCGVGKVSTLGSGKCSYSSSVVAGFGVASSGASTDGGPATVAYFSNPSAMAVNKLTNVMYIADTNNHVIRLIDLNSGIISRFAGQYGGSATTVNDGSPATSAYLYYPMDVKVDLSGNVYVADTSHSQIRIVNVFTKIISNYAGVSNTVGTAYGGPASSSYLNNPTGIALDVSANLFIADTNNGRICYVSKSLGTMTVLIVGATYFGANWSPSSIAVDPTGTNVYTTVGTISTPVYGIIYKFISNAGALSTYSTVAGTGSLPWTVETSFITKDRVGTSIYLPNPTGVALDPFANIYFSDATHGMVGVINNVTGMVSSFMGTGYPGYRGDDGPSTQIALNNPLKVAFDPLGNFYVADQANGRIRKAATGQSAPTCAAGQVWYSSQCVGCCICPAGYYCPGDNYQHPCPINTYSSTLGATTKSTCLPCPSGTFSSIGSASKLMNCINTALTVVAGSPFSNGYSGDGGAATSATMVSPHDVAVDSSNNFYILDLNYNVVRKVSSTTGIITTVAGNGNKCTYGYSDVTDGSPTPNNYFPMTALYQSHASCGDGGAATSARFNNAYGIAVDVSGNMFIADRGNLVIRKMAANGIMSTVAGNGYYSSGSVNIGSNQCTTQQCCNTCNCATCYDTCCNNCYVVGIYTPNSCFWCGSSNCNAHDCNCDTCCHWCGTCYYTIYSAGSVGLGDGGAATSAYFSSPSGVAVDISGNLYIADTGDNRIRKVAATTQYITTLVYVGTAGASSLSSPWRIAVDQTGKTLSHHPIT